MKLYTRSNGYAGPDPWDSADPSEPIYSGAEGQTSVDYETFESYADAAAWIAAARTYSTSGMSIEPSGGVGGGQHARATYTAAGGGMQQVVIGKYLADLAPDVDSMISSWYFRFTNGYDFIGDANTHKLMEHIDEEGISGSTRMLLSSGGESPTPDYYQDGEGPYPITNPANQLPHVSFGGTETCLRQNLNWPRVVLEAVNATAETEVVISDGQWHRWTMRAKRSLNGRTVTSSVGVAGQGTACIEVWVDGIKILEYLGDDSGRPEYNEIDGPASPAVTMYDWQTPTTRNSSTASDVNVDVDNVRIWYEA